MYKKKITYSLFTIPIAVTSFGVYEWQKRRYLEKNAETDLRKTRINAQPEDISKYYNQQSFPWLDLNLREFNKEYAYKPFELIGVFDHSREIRVNKLKDGDEGYQIITPFYCYTDESGEPQALLVDRGWVPKDFLETFRHRSGAQGSLTIRGLIYKTEGVNKYTEKENQINLEKFYTINPVEISTFLLLPNKNITSKFLVKQIELNPNVKTSFPKILNIEDLTNFKISKETNRSYLNLWVGLTFVNIFSNMFVWLYL